MIFLVPSTFIMAKSRHPENIAFVDTQCLSDLNPVDFLEIQKFLIMLDNNKTQYINVLNRVLSVKSTSNIHHPVCTHMCKHTMFLKSFPCPLEDMFFLLWKENYFSFQIQHFPTWLPTFWANHCKLHYPSLKLTGHLFQKDVIFFNV